MIETIFLHRSFRIVYKDKEYCDYEQITSIKKIGFAQMLSTFCRYKNNSKAKIYIKKNYQEVTFEIFLITIETY